MAQSETAIDNERDRERADLRWGSVGALVQDCRDRFGDLEALVDLEAEGGPRRWTFAQLADDVLRAAHAFAAAGLQKGDRVGIWAPNIWEWIVAGMGVVTAGGILVPLNTRYKGPEAAFVLAKSRAKMLLCVNGFLGTDYVAGLRAAMADGEPLPALERVIVLRGDAPDGTTAWDDFFAAAPALSALTSPLPSMGPDDLCDIIFTSGTTGRPKGAMVAHGQNLRVFQNWSGCVALRKGDRYLIVNPFFHTFGYKAGIISCFLSGATMVPQAVFDVDESLRRIAAEKITVVPGPPTLFLAVLDSPNRDRHDLTSLRTAITGAAATPVSMVERMRDEMTFKVILTGYGLTESTGVVSMCDIDDDAETIANTSGKPMPGFEVRVVDDNGTEVPRGTPGEIVARGYNVMRGYFEDPERTAETIDSDGWLHTGDVGVMDERGYLCITDRIKDMFIVGGFNAYPAEIEDSLMRHPAIAQAAVVGMPDERMGEVGCAFVVARPGAAIDEAEVIAWSRERMANFKVPRRVVAIDALPLNATGKVLKYELRERVAHGHL